MTGGILDDCFASYRTSAVRLETLPAYAVRGEAEAIAAWKQGRPRPERSLRTDDYLREIAGDVLAGRERMRVRVADHPLSEYTEWELAGYAENAAAGEHTLIAVRRGGTPQAERNLAVASRDFWAFDLGTEDERVVLLDYDQDGQFESAHLATATDAEWCRKMWRVAVSYAVPLNEYAAARAKAAAAA